MRNHVVEVVNEIGKRLERLENRTRLILNVLYRLFGDEAPIDDMKGVARRMIRNEIERGER